MRLAGAVRDYDIATKLIAKLKAPVTLRHRLHRRRVQAEGLLMDSLRDWVTRGFTAKWRSKLMRDRNAPAVNGLLPAVKLLFKRGAKAEHSAPALHKLRIAAKKLRYTMELAPSNTVRLDQIKALQSKLGDINDYETTRRIAVKEGASNRIAVQLEEKEEKKTRQFRRYWKDEFAGKEREWIADLTHPRKRA